MISDVNNDVLNAMTSNFINVSEHMNNAFSGDADDDTAESSDDTDS